MFKRYQKTDLEEITFELKNQRALIVQTDTIYGILSLDQSLIYRIKHRSLKKKIVLFVNELKNAPKKVEEFVQQFWPGGLTVILNGVSYRCPNDAWIQEIIRKVGPIYCSSANISDQETIHNLDEADHVFEQKFFYDLFLVEGNSEHPSNIPSTIVDCDHWSIIRAGDHYDAIKQWIKEH